MRNQAGVLGFVGRRRELTSISRCFELLDDGNACLAQVIGEAGMGKTRLLSEAQQLAAGHVELMLSGRATEFERTTPYAVIIDAFRDLLSSDEHLLERADLDRQTAAELGFIFPRLKRPAFESRALPVERHRAFRAMRTLIERLARRGSVLISLDDLHWADEASLELISYLVRHLPDAPVLLLLSSRPHVFPRQFSSALAAAARQGVCEQLELEPLSKLEARQLLGFDSKPSEPHDSAFDSMFDSIYEASGGNPFYLQQLSTGRVASAQHGYASAGLIDTTPAGLPPAVAAAIGQEIEGLSPGAKLVAWAASVVGEPFSPELLSAAAQKSTDEITAGLDELCQRGLIRESKPNVYGFRHPIVASAVYASAGPGWRIEAHRRVAEALRRSGAAAHLRARHIERSAATGDQAAIAILTEAAREIALHAPAASAHWYEAALRLIPESAPNNPKRLELLVPLGVALGSAGRLREAQMILREVIRALPPDRVDLRSQAAFFGTNVEIMRGNIERARSDLEHMVAEFAGQDDPSVYLISSALAVIGFLHGDLEVVRHWAQPMLAGPAPDEVSKTIALGILAASEGFLGDGEPKPTLVDRAAMSLDMLSSGEIGERMAVFFWVAWAEILHERFDEALRHLDRGIEVCRAAGRDQFFVLLLLQRANAFLYCGRVREALSVLAESTEAATLSGNDLGLAAALGLRCRAETLKGDYFAAIQAGERAVTAAESIGGLFGRLAECWLAEAWLEAGDPERARALLFSEEFSTSARFPLTAAHWRRVLCETMLALSDPPAAEEQVAACTAAAERAKLSLWQSEAASARASLELAQDDASSAVTNARAALDHAEEGGDPIEAARVRLLLGRSLAAMGDSESAVAELQTAQTEFSEYGTEGLHARASSELRRLGGQPGASASWVREEGLDALTKRELEVAELVGQGKRNREIAAQLFITTKTVEAHVSRILSKLGLRSRWEIAQLTVKDQQRQREAV